MAIQKLQSGPLHLLVAWSFTWAISHFCWWPMCKRWGQAFVKVKWWKLDYSDIQIICRKLATSTKWACWFVSSSCTLTICFRCFFQAFFFLSCFQISSRQVFGRSYRNCLRNGKDLFNWRASSLEFAISWAHHISSLPFCPIQGACWIPFFGASAIAVPSSHNSVQPLKPYETWLKNEGSWFFSFFVFVYHLHIKCIIYASYISLSLCLYSTYL